MSRGNKRGRGRGRGRGFSAGSRYEIDAIEQLAGSYSYTGRGRGTRFDSPSPRGRGFGRGRGRGGGTKRPISNSNGTLSDLLHQERPLLRPIVFVRSTQTPFLFQIEEDILQPLVEDVTDEAQSHLPTADKVARVFSAGLSQAGLHSDLEELQEIDFNDLEKLEQLAPSTSAPKVAGQSTGSFAATESLTTSSSVQGTMPPSHNKIPQALSTMMSNFYIDTEPSKASADTEILVDKMEGSLPLGAGVDEDLIVYEAPNPRKGPLGPVSSSNNCETPPTSTPATFSETVAENEIVPHSISTSDPAVTSEVPVIPATPPSFESVSFNFSSSPNKPHHRSSLVLTIHNWNKARLVRRRQQAFRARKSRESLVLLATNVSEAQSHDGDAMWNEGRRDESDIDWGDGNNDEEDVAEGMSVDPELEQLDIRVLQNFVRRMDQDGSRFKTMDDIADEQKMEAEGLEESMNQASSDEESDDEDEDEDEVVNKEEAILVGDSEDESSGDEDFQHRLQRLRNASENHHEPTETSENEPPAEMWDEDDDYDFFQEMLDKHVNITSGRDRSARKNVHGEEFGGEEGWIPAKRRKDKGKGYPAELQELWKKDREKKAARKRERELARLENAADPLGKHKGGIKGRKAMRAAARLDPEITVIRNRVIDMVTLVQQIRRFITELNGPSSLSLPPADKGTRKQVHELAVAFNLKSVSKGKGDARYTTLFRTSRTGTAVDEKKVGRIVRRNRGGEFVDRPERHRYSKLSQKEGDEVGKAAPKIGETNIGFRMLTLMGWSEGDRIGMQGGSLQNPLTAVIKHTKLGLGASK